MNEIEGSMGRIICQIRKGLLADRCGRSPIIGAGANRGAVASKPYVNLQLIYRIRPQRG